MEGRRLDQLTSGATILVREILHNQAAKVVTVPFAFLPDQSLYSLVIRNVRRMLIANSKNQDTYVSSLSLNLPFPGADYSRSEDYWRDKINHVHCLVPDPYWSKWASEAGDDPVEGEYRGRCLMEGPPHTPTPAFFELKVFFESLDIDLKNDRYPDTKIWAEDNQVLKPEDAKVLIDFGKGMADFGMKSLFGMFDAIRKATGTNDPGDA